MNNLQETKNLAASNPWVEETAGGDVNTQDEGSSSDSINLILGTLGDLARRVLSLSPEEMKEKGGCEIEKINCQLRALCAFSDKKDPESSFEQWLRENLCVVGNLTKQDVWFENVTGVIHAAKKLQESNPHVLLKKTEGPQDVDASKDLSEFDSFFGLVLAFFLKEETARENIHQSATKKFLASLNEMNFRGSPFNKKHSPHHVPSLFNFVQHCGERHFVWLTEDIICRRELEWGQVVAQSIGKIHKANAAQEIVLAEKELLRKEFESIPEVGYISDFIHEMMVAQMSPIVKEAYTASSKSQKQNRGISPLLEKNPFIEKCIDQARQKSEQNPKMKDLVFLENLLSLIEEQRSEKTQKVGLTFEIYEKLRFFLNGLDQFKACCVGMEKEAIFLAERRVELEERLKRIIFNFKQSSPHLLKKTKDLLKGKRDTSEIDKEIENSMGEEICELLGEMESILLYLPTFDELRDKDIGEFKIRDFLYAFPSIAQKTQRLMMKTATSADDVKAFLQASFNNFKPETRQVLQKVLQSSQEKIADLSKKTKTDVSWLKDQIDLWMTSIEGEQKKEQAVDVKKLDAIFKKGKWHSKVGEQLEKSFGFSSIKYNKQEHVYQREGLVGIGSIQRIDEEFLPIANNSPVKPLCVDDQYFECPAILRADICRMNYKVGGVVIPDSTRTDNKREEEKIEHLVRALRKMNLSAAAFETLIGIINQGAFVTVIEEHARFLSKMWPSGAIQDLFDAQVLVEGSRKVPTKVSIERSSLLRAGVCITYTHERVLTDTQPEEGLLPSGETDPMKLVLQVTVFNDGTTSADHLTVYTNAFPEKAVQHILTQLRKRKT